MTDWNTTIKGEVVVDEIKTLKAQPLTDGKTDLELIESHTFGNGVTEAQLSVRADVAAVLYKSAGGVVGFSMAR